MYISDDLFCCYNVRVYNFITKEKNIPYVDTFKSLKDGRVAALFERTNELTMAMREFAESNNLR